MDPLGGIRVPRIGLLGIGARTCPFGFTLVSLGGPTVQHLQNHSTILKDPWRLFPAKKRNFLEVWFRYFSFLNEWFVGSMLVFQGVPLLQTTAPAPENRPKPNMNLYIVFQPPFFRDNLAVCFREGFWDFQHLPTMRSWHSSRWMDSCVRSYSCILGAVYLVFGLFWSRHIKAFHPLPLLKLNPASQNSPYFEVIHPPMIHCVECYDRGQNMDLLFNDDSLRKLWWQWKIHHLNAFPIANERFSNVMLVLRGL